MNISPPSHGGNLSTAMQQFGGVLDDWLDLSTGISPWAYPELEVEQSIWRQLPNDGTSLRTAAAKYYDCQLSELHLTPGSQLAIRILPTLLQEKQCCALPTIGYKEHEFAWASAGHQPIKYGSISELINLAERGELGNAVVINPNNPTGEFVCREQLCNLAKHLHGILIIDEAFADFDNRNSLSAEKNLSNIIVLRSIGKFFGLAGARIGFTITHHPLGSQLDSLFSPWSVNAAAQVIAERAFNNHAWQVEQRRKIRSQSQEFTTTLKDFIDTSGLILRLTSQALFTTLFGDDTQIKGLHSALALQRVWTRLGDTYTDQNATPQNWLRVSLPGQHLAQFNHALLRLSISNISTQ